MDTQEPPDNRFGDSLIARRIDAVRTLGDWRQLERGGSLADMGADSLGALIGLLRREEYGRAGRFWLTLIVTLLPVEFAWMVLCLALRWNGVAYVAVLAPLLLVFSHVRASALSSQASQKLAEVATVDSIPALVTSLAYSPFRTGRTICEALARVMPQCSRLQFEELSVDDRERLYGAMQKSSVDYAIAAMGVALRFEDTIALGHVRAFTTYGSQFTEKELDVRLTARRCLDVLEQKIERERFSDTLLRPANSPVAVSLLRPANTSAGGTNLLHAAAESLEMPQQPPSE